MNITPAFIDAIAPNASAIANGKSLSKKFTVLHISPDKTLLFGECPGSGKNPYVCSMDFLDPAAPVPRCSCPSRQFPCKHVVGLLYAYADGRAFSAAEIPETVAAKREGATKHAEKKEKKAVDISAPPGKAKITAALKKIAMQLEGLDTADKLLQSILRTGLSGLDARMRTTLAAQITQLGNYHIKGVQASFNELLLYINEGKHFTRSTAQLAFLHALLKRARAHLLAKRDSDNPLTLDIASEIEEQIGHIWKLEELHAYGCTLPGAELVQLSFAIHDDAAKKEFVDEGLHICVQNGAVYATKNYRPYKSVKYINQDNTRFGTLTADIAVYPGGLNRRIRYDKFTLREEVDYAAIKAHASTDFAETAKLVKNQLKTPLADKNPAALLKIARLFTSDAGQVLIEDAQGTRQILQGNTVDLLTLIDASLLAGHALLVRYDNDIDAGLLSAMPLSLITDDRIIRFQF